MSVFENGEREIAFFRQMPQNVNVRNFNFISTTMPRLPYRISQECRTDDGGPPCFFEIMWKLGSVRKIAPRKWTKCVLSQNFRKNEICRFGANCHSYKESWCVVVLLTISVRLRFVF